MPILAAILVPFIVGFVTASIKSYADRVFLVLLSLMLLRLPIGQAILVNLIVTLLAGLLLAVRRPNLFRFTTRDWLITLLPAFLGGFAARTWAVQSAGVVPILLGVLGVYAIAVGLRLGLLKPRPPAEVQELLPGRAWTVGLAGGLLSGLVSAGGKPLAVPVLVAGFKQAQPRAYQVALFGVLAAAIGGLTAQGIFAAGAFTAVTGGWALYLVAAISLVSWVTDRFWSARLQQVVSYIVAPVLVLVGIRLFLMI